MAAIIPINKCYRIELDSHSWQVSKWIPRKSRPNGGSWEGTTWHRSIQQAGESLVQRMVGELDLEGVDEVIRAIQVTSTLIATAVASTLIATAIRDCPFPDSWLMAKEQHSGIGC